MSDPVFSIAAPAIHSEFYKWAYDSLSHNNKIPFEMIFVGHNPPTENIGKYFKYVYSTVKPAQCLEIGVRKSKGQYIIPMADDMKYSDGFLNNLYEEISHTDLNKYFLSFMGFHPGKINKNFQQYKVNNYCGVPIGWCGCFPRELWKKLEGIDRRFIHAYFDVDLHMRCYEFGLQFRLAKDIYVREFYPDFGPKQTKEKEMKKFRAQRLKHKYRGCSRVLIDSLWVKSDGTASKKRLLSFEPFEDKDIMTITQGPKGEWQ